MFHIILYNSKKIDTIVDTQYKVNYICFIQNITYGNR